MVFYTWPWRMLQLRNPRLSDVKLQRLRAKFFNVPSCDLDNGFSLPLRSDLTGVSDLQKGKVVRMLEKLMRKLKITNMPIENLLSQVGSASRSSRSSHSAERVCYGGLLTQMMSTFLADGAPDLRKDSARQFQSGNVPVRAHRSLPKHPFRRQGRPREHLAWINSQVRELAGNDSSNDPSRAHARRQLFTRWRNMNQQARVRALLALHGRSSGRKPSMGNCTTHAAVDNVVKAWGMKIAGPGWPVSPARVKKFLDKSKPQANWRGCFAPPEVGMSRIKALRWQRRLRLIGRKRTMIPSNRVYRLALPCPEKHCGLCETNDEAIYEQTLAGAGQIERCMGKEHVWKFFHFFDPDNHTTSIDVFFAAHRARRRYAQCTHVFAEVHEMLGKYLCVQSVS